MIPAGFRVIPAALTIAFPAMIAAAPADGRTAAALPMPEAAKSFALRAEQAFAAGNLKEAGSLYRQALASAPNQPPLLVSLAAVETRLGNLDESELLLRHALGIDLSNAPAWLLFGMNCLERKRDEEAFAALAQAVLHDGNNPRARNYFGIAAGRKGWPEASEQELRRAVELDPGYADANFNLAVLYLRRTPPLIELARRHYQRALELGCARDPAVEAQLASSGSSHSKSTP